MYLRIYFEKKIVDDPPLAAHHQGAAETARCVGANSRGGHSCHHSSPPMRNKLINAKQ
jgi:hypothetical protein